MTAHNILTTYSMKEILTIGFDIPGYAEQLVSFGDDRSILDADIVLIDPHLYDFTLSDEYQGTPLMSQRDSARYRKATDHWRAEIRTALEHGQTLFCFLTAYKEFCVYTGTQELSGTGRSQRRINHVGSASNYDWLPIQHPPIVPKSGTGIRSTGDPRVSTYWMQFANYTRYESYFSENIEEPLFVTKTASRPVGGIFRVGNGHLVGLPPVRYPEEEFLMKDKEHWRKAAVAWGHRFVESLVGIADVLNKQAVQTPPPAWSKTQVYELKAETALEKKLADVRKKKEALDKREADFHSALLKERSLKGLLYEKGPALEIAILDALKILGYEAERYDDGSLELDSIIVSPEGSRCLGEAEGRDQAAIGVDKFRQLLGNIQEDLGREEVSEPAGGILFGNGFRLEAPDARHEQFTEKCLKNAAINSVALVRTTDLYQVAKYVLENCPVPVRS